MQTKKLLSAMMFSIGLMAVASQAHAVSICIDPGHGGEDTGAIGCSLVEKEINLSVALKLRSLMQAAGYTVYMTRTDDSTVELSARGAYANSKGVDTFASIHTNSATAVVSGIETFCMKGCLEKKGNNYQQASNIQSEMLNVWRLDSRGVKDANFAVLRQTSMPATLTELGFINNCDDDATYLRDDYHRQNAAAAHCRALIDKWGGDRNKCLSGGSSGETGTVMGGTFLNSIGGEWLGGVTVRIGDQSVVSSDSKSNWQLTVPVGHYELTASKTGYSSVTRDDCEDVVAGKTSWCSVALTPVSDGGGEPGRVYGTVQNSETGDLISAMVVVNGNTQMYDGETEWSFELPAGTYQITASAEGFGSKSVECVVSSREEVDCSIVLDPQYGTIVGTVVDSESYQPLVADVSLGDKTQHYTGIGLFSFSEPVGVYTLTAMVQGYDVGIETCNAVANTTNECNFELKKSDGSVNKHFLKGMLLNSKTQEPIPGVVTISDDLVFHYTGRGQYQFYLQPGSYQLLGESDGYQADSKLCIVTADGDSTCDISLTPLDGKLRGFVYQAGSRRSLLAATVSVAGQQIPYSGHLTWSVSLPPGKYDVTAVAQTGETGKTTCTVNPGKTTTCNIAIIIQDNTSKVGTLMGTVSQKGTNMLIPATVSIDGFETVTYSGRVDSPWIYPALPEGKYRVHAISNGFNENMVTCEVVADQTKTCDIELTEIESTTPSNPSRPNIPDDSQEPQNPEISGDPQNPQTPERTTDPEDPSSSEQYVQFKPKNDDSCSATPLHQSNSMPFGIMALCGACIFAFYRRRNKGENK